MPSVPVLNPAMKPGEQKSRCNSVAPDAATSASGDINSIGAAMRSDMATARSIGVTSLSNTVSVST